MINIMPIFINFLAVDSLRLDNDRIEKFCLENRKNSPGRVISNAAAGKAAISTCDAGTGGAVRGSPQKAGGSAPRLRVQHILRQVITEAWININQKGHFNYSHNHPGSLVFRRVLCERRHRQG